MSEIRFDSLDPIEEVVHLGGREYRLCETSGDASVRYENARLACYEYQEASDGSMKLRSIRNLADLEPLLVSLCLVDDAGVPVPESTIRGWPSRVQDTLYQRARVISGLSEQSSESIDRQITQLQQQLAEAKAREDARKNS